MNYLIIEGYQSAAIKFAQEANISPSIDLDSINDRIAIRNAIYRGDIQGAIEHINELNPEVGLQLFAQMIKLFHAPLLDN